LLCYACDGQMKRVHKAVEATWKGRTVVFRGMPAWVCEDCQEEAYEPDDARMMQALIDGMSSDKEPPEIMNVEEVSDLLRVSSQTVYNMARQGKLPATKVGREWRFSREGIRRLVSGQPGCRDSGTHGMVSTFSGSRCTC